MAEVAPSSLVCGNCGYNGTLIPYEEKEGDMGKEDRMEIVLRFLQRHGLALPPRVIYRNLRYHHNITFSLRSTSNYLAELADMGLLARVEPEPLENREIVQMGPEGSNSAYYIITDDGRVYLDSSMSD